ncbi:hybrid sensor histidine kinase/response regulator [Pseudoduganella umbonata]|uniref:histidine kinase n=1 Tax=Pseudoduganella umbonata TaxID=864828 RepID=A0A4P8HZ63_9BURK|nr:hybrid sensor histidine kinase/response regulator [Pseudoduganella umbonata]MBB3224160.1 signal transduction histidine kinase/CheY-like chemotaxis protein [Pseudoduganella umbonata]QCP13980.1 response regulator [Pseudoduganella umbonata]
MMADLEQPQDNDSQHVAELRLALRQARFENNLLREANSHLVQATVTAQTLQDEAEAANQRQNEFLAMLAHELRNPLAPISMAAAMLERMPHLSPELVALRSVISRQTEHMARLLDDLLDAARISSGRITLDAAPVALADVIERAVETVQPRVTERGQRLDVRVTAPELTLNGDRVRLTQVFSNLLANASKYTQDGGHLVLEAGAGPAGVQVTVSDNGTGIAADVLPHIFDLFTQGPRSLARSEGGLGVGLNVVRNLVHMHGGTVQAHSGGPGCGSIFTVEMPAGGPMPAAEPASATVSHEACRVLLIEDNVDVCDTLKGFLMLDAHDVTAAYDGIAGLALAQQGGFDVLICDIGLPGHDGLEVIRRLRAGGSRLFAIALSGYSQAQDREGALAAGFDAYLVKPVRPDSLLAMIDSQECRARRATGC